MQAMPHDEDVPRPKPPQPPKRKNYELPPELVEEIRLYRFRRMLASEKAAVVELIRRGLEAAAEEDRRARREGD